MACGEKVPTDQMVSLNNDLWHYLTMPLMLTNDCVIFLGFITIFIVFRDRKKPPFVTVIWILMFLCAACNIIQVVSYNQSIEIKNAEKQKLLHNTNKVAIVVVQVLSQIIHWLFVE